MSSLSVLQCTRPIPTPKGTGATLDRASVSPNSSIHSSTEPPSKTAFQRFGQCRVALQHRWPTPGLRVRRISHGLYRSQDFFDPSFLDQVGRSKAVKVLVPRIQPCSRCPWVGIELRKPFDDVFKVNKEALRTRSGVGTPLIPPGHRLGRGPQHVCHIGCSNGSSASQQPKFLRQDVLFRGYTRHLLYPVYRRAPR